MNKEVKKVWLVTGTSTGIGRVVVEKLLSDGYFVAGTARNIEKIQEFEKNYPSQFLAIEANVDIFEDNQKTVQHTLERFGRIDVLMNNAGYGLTGVVEELSQAQIRQQMETNFFGLVELTQLVLPTMRKQKSGYIINVSSIAGLRGMRGMAVYNASKFAVEGFSEGLAQEVSPFGIKVSLVEPGPYRTDWAGRSLMKSEQMTEKLESPYEQVNLAIDQMFQNVSGNQPGKPEQIASVLISAAESENAPLHMVFGDEAIKIWQDYFKKLQDNSFLREYPHSKYDV